MTLYQRWGGTYPIDGLQPGVFGPALAITVIHIVLDRAVWLPYLLSTYDRGTPAAQALARRFLIVSLGLPSLAEPFAIIAAGLWIEHGVGLFLFSMGGLFIVSWLAHQLSHAASRSALRSRELEQLEQLSQALLKAPPDASTLPQILADHVPALFSPNAISIVLWPDRVLLRHPIDQPLVDEAAWTWLRSQSHVQHIPAHSVPPWSRQPIEEAALLAPIFSAAAAQRMIGGVYLSQKRIVRDAGAATSSLSAVQAVADQIASALHQAELNQRMLASQRVEQELALAAQDSGEFPADRADRCAGLAVGGDVGTGPTDFGRLLRLGSVGQWQTGDCRSGCGR